MAQKVAPLAKQLSMKAIDVIHYKGISAVGDLAGKSFSAAKNKIMSLVRTKKTTNGATIYDSDACKGQQSIKIAMEEKLASLAAAPSDAQSNSIMNMIAGSGLKAKRKPR